MSREDIIAIAISHFNKFGYRGTNLSQIAEEVGIRKQSLAYHFPNKRLLFHEVYKKAVEDEVQFIQLYFQEHSEEPIEQQLYHYLTEHKGRFLTNPSTQLMLTISFLIPDEIYEDVIQKPYRYIDMLTDTLESCFAKQTFRLSAKECALAFVALLDGLDIQLVYEDTERYDKLQKITWDIFWKGIQA